MSVPKPAISSGGFPFEFRAVDIMTVLYRAGPQRVPRAKRRGQESRPGSAIGARGVAVSRVDPRALLRVAST